MTKQTHFIHGEWVDGSGESFTASNPATNVEHWQGNSASKSEVTDAVVAAQNTFPAWSQLSFSKRQKYLETFIAKLKEVRDQFAETISRDNGKPLWEAKTEVGAMLNKLKITIDSYNERTGGHPQLTHKPHGVVAVFGPFNFPGHLPNGHILPALLAGNTIVYKPSEQTPLVAERMLQLWSECNLPAGVLNMVQGGRDTGIALAAADIDGLFFTGSATVGRSLHKQFGGHPEKILALELGGNNPLVITDISDIDAAVYNTIQSAFITSGQRCTCARRLIIVKQKNTDEFLVALTKAASELVVGSYTDTPEPFCGPVISPQSAKNVITAQSNLQKAGGIILLEAKIPQDNFAFVTPGIIDVSNNCERNDEECFGPLLQIIRCGNFDAAIVEANNTKYGLSAGLFSDDADNFAKFRQQTRAGIVNWNKPLTGAASSSPFGGIGWSGNHRPSAYYAADYCAYPVASLQAESLSIPEKGK